MGKIEVKLVRRHIGTLRHEAHVAQSAGIDYRLKLGARDGVEFTAFRIVDQVKKSGKTVAQTETPPAAVTDIKDTTHLRVDFLSIGEIRFFPRNCVSYRCTQAAFAHPGATLHCERRHFKLLSRCPRRMTSIPIRTTISIVARRRPFSQKFKLLVERIKRPLKPAGMASLGFGQRLKPVRNFVETLIAGCFSHSGIHVGVLVGFSRNGRLEVG